MSLKISIGILAYNEASRIERMLKSLFRQNLFSDNSINAEILLVPNGCTDNTAETARSALPNLLKPLSSSHLDFRICELEQAGKSNAWNVYVHELSCPNAKYLFLMDADIELLDLKTLASMIDALERTPEASVVVDRPIKDVTLKPKKSLMDYLSIFASKLSGDKSGEEGPAWLCGQLYCARAEVLRKTWLPIQLPTQDSFLYDLIVTDGFCLSENPKRIIRTRSASHVFEAYTNFDKLLRHEKWLILGRSVNQLVYDSLLAESENSENKDVRLLIKARNEQSPNWLYSCVEKAVEKQGFWLVPNSILVRRWISLRYQSLLKALFMFPLALAAFLIDFYLAWQANSELHRSSKLGYWGK